MTCQKGGAAPVNMKDGVPLKKDRARDAMEAVFQRTAESLRFRHPHIPYAVAVMVMELAFHTKDPNGV